VLLRRQDDGTTVAIGQASHAWVSGQLARAWGNERFPAPDPFEEVCLAAEQHDIGWTDWDLRPSLNPRTGLPYTFIELPVSAHIELWSAAPAKLVTQSRYAALLASMHGTTLQARRDLHKLEPADRALVERYLEQQHTRQRELIELLGADRDQLERNRRLLWAWDGISLALCLGWQTLMNEVPAASAGAELALELTGTDLFTLDPWPFARHELELRCEGRKLTGPFESDTAIREALDHAPSVSLSFALVPKG
jgi:Protein of unknown function (DUF3891)